MKRAPFIHASLTLALLGLACSNGGGGGGDVPPGPQPGNAYLTIQGDTNVFMEYGDSTQLVVMYHDGQQYPLAGTVNFQIDGYSAGSTLSSGSGVTDANGLARVTLTAGVNEQVSYKIVASAEYADPVEWHVAVTQGQLPMQIDGPYALESQFDLSTGLPGTIGEVVNTIIDMTDGPNDPATFVLDKLEEHISSGFIRDAIDAARPALDATLNDIIIDHAPGLVTNFINLGNQLGQVTREFGMKSTLTVATNPMDQSQHLATHTLTGILWTVDGVVYEYSAADIGIEGIEALNVLITQDGSGKVYIAQHTLAVPYGKVLLYAMNNVLVPLIDPFASDLEEVMTNMVDCAQVGQDIYDELGIGSASLYESTCLTALGAAAGAIEDQILSIDAEATSFVIQGDATPIDTNGDGMVDKLQNGLWDGFFNVGTVSSTLARPDQKFLGERMATP